MKHRPKEATYFPGCSLETTAKEANQSLLRACSVLGLELVEIDDWNCCGSSSAHSLDPHLATSLAARNLLRCPPGKPLLVMCPACYRNLRIAQHHMLEDPALRREQENMWGARLDSDLRIITLLEIRDLLPGPREALRSLGGLKAAPYYGCMRMFPPALPGAAARLRGTLESALEAMGAEVLAWSHKDLCCGTFLSVGKPELAASNVERIMNGARAAGAECLVTACAMCQLNLEIRCAADRCLPTLHFTEVLALALGARATAGWFTRHLIDPQPLLVARGLL